jgi:hypothetical protein
MAAIVPILSSRGFRSRILWTGFVLFSALAAIFVLVQPRFLGMEMSGGSGSRTYELGLFGFARINQSWASGMSTQTWSIGWSGAIATLMVLLLVIECTHRATGSIWGPAGSRG